MQCKISVCIPTYNSEKTLRRTLNSVFQQDYENKEVILVDNDSHDDTISIASEYLKEGLIILQNDSNLGVNSNHNCCMKAASGAYIHLLSSDDYYENSKALGKIAMAISQLPTDGCVGVGSVGGRVGTGQLLYGIKSVQSVLLSEIPFKQIPSLMVFSRNLILGDRFQTTNTDGYGDDTSFYFRIMLRGPYFDMMDQLVVYSINEGSITQGLNRNGMGYKLHKYSLDKWASEYKLSATQRWFVMGRESARVLREMPITLGKIKFMRDNYSIFELLLGGAAVIRSRVKELFS